MYTFCVYTHTLNNLIIPQEICFVFLTELSNLSQHKHFLKQLVIPLNTYQYIYIICHYILKIKIMDENKEIRKKFFNNKHILLEC